MGNSPNRCTRPGKENFDLPYSSVYVSEHACEKPESCDVISDVDEDYVNRELEIGKTLGVFAPWNNCQTYNREVFKKCSKNPSPSQPNVDPFYF